MEIQERRVGAVAILDLNGDLASLDGEDFRCKIDALLQQETKRILINLADLSPADTAHLEQGDNAGLTELVRSVHTARRRGAELKWCVTPHLDRILSRWRMGLAVVPDIHESEASALRAFGHIGERPESLA